MERRPARKVSIETVRTKAPGAAAFGVGAAGVILSVILVHTPRGKARLTAGDART
jgi:hypothetical protein